MRLKQPLGKNLQPFMNILEKVVKNINELRMQPNFRENPKEIQSKVERRKEQK